MPMEYIVPSLCIVATTSMDDAEQLQERIVQLIQLEEDLFFTGFHQRVEKYWKKAWHDHHIKNKQFTHGYLVLLYDNKFMKHPGKLQMHWLGPYLVHSITSGGAVQLQQLDGAVFPNIVNGSHLKPYKTGVEGCTV